MNAITSSSEDVKEYQDKRRVTVVGAVINLVLAVAKVVFGIIGQSQALIADGLHSFSDLVSDAMVLYAAKHSSRGPDADHPYGHARFETAATVGLGLLLMLVAIGIIMDASERMFDPNSLLNPGWLALTVAIVSILSKEYLYHYTMIVARRLRSNMLRANAWHHRSDAVSSIVVVVGIAGSMAGLPYLDSVGAVLVGLMIAKIGWELGWHSLRELVDTALKPETLTEIRETILSVAGVKSMHKLRTRRMGGKGLINVHIVVDPKVTVSEGHQISENVRSRLRAEVEDILDVTVHIDPEDDAEQKPTQGLPGREQMIKQLKKCWSSLDTTHSIERVNLHYLNGKVDVELLLPMSVMRDKEHAQQIADEYSRQSKRQEGVGEVKVCFH